MVQGLGFRVLTRVISGSVYTPITPPLRGGGVLRRYAEDSALTRVVEACYPKIM